MKGGCFAWRRYSLRIRDVFEGEPKIVVDFFDGLTAEYAQKISADYLVRGLRNGSDFDYEKTISQVNQTLAKGLETIFFISSPSNTLLWVNTCTSRLETATAPPCSISACLIQVRSRRVSFNQTFCT